MGNRLYVGNLAYTLTQEDLKGAFGSSGNVTFVRLMTDRETGQPRGFGFVQFATDAEAKQAVSDWDGKELGGRRLVVNEARERSDPSSPRPSGPPGPSRAGSAPPVEVYSRGPSGIPGRGAPRPQAGERARRNPRDYSSGFDD